MKRADWIFTIGTIAVIGFFIWLSMFTGHKPYPLPATPEHQTATTQQECLACHDPAKPGVVKPIPAKHPQAWKDQRFKCTVCHLQTK
ncbi:MAG: hypothetical protein HY314_09275 [Acidobacteria bacterium]|nr:hypothetical protein [Acidobacteriota bacterium]